MAMNAEHWLVTGKLVSGRKVRIETTSYWYAMRIPLDYGRVWHVDNGRRELVKTVAN